MQKLCFVASVILFSMSAWAAEKFREEDVTIQNQKLALKGTVAVPLGNSNDLPCVLLLSGSGPTDRNGNQPDLITDFHKQIAHHLAKSGVVSLRFDKRAVARYARDWPRKLEEENNFFSWDSFVADAEAALKFLQKFKGVDPRGCAVMGHSEGGLIALALAERVPVRLLLLMATPGRNPSVVTSGQISSLLDRQKAPPKEKKFFVDEYQRLTHYVIEHGEVPDDVPQGLRPLFPPSAGKYLQVFLQLEPLSLARAYKGPAVVMNGQRDIQVNAKLDAEVLYESFRSRGLKQESLHLFPGLSHNFKVVTTAEDNAFSGTVPAEVLEKLAHSLRK